MWMIGKANNDECNAMANSGFEVKPVDEFLFNKCLDIHYDPKRDPDLLEPDADEDQNVAVYVDCDIAKECAVIHEADRKATTPAVPALLANDQNLIMELAIQALGDRNILDEVDISDDEALYLKAQLKAIMNPEEVA